MKSNKATGGLVYSTEHGKMCPECRKPIAECVCNRNTAIPVSDGIVRISRETKGRKGKGVTLIKGLTLDAPALAQLGKQLKAVCGSGGTVKDGMIEIQGDHCERATENLKKQGWVVKLIGG
jgi:translation initiation factor 1